MTPKVTIINDEIRARYFTNFNRELLRRIREIKLNQTKRLD